MNASGQPMRELLPLVFVASLVSVAGISSASAASSHYVRGYSTMSGTYVAPHRQTNPNKSLFDNWSTKGNVNPFTGKPGTKNPY
jgi:hypothetical protein